MEKLYRKYVPRIVDKLLELYLESSGAVLVEGAKWCGKTTTSRHFSKSSIELGDPDREDEYMALATISPSRLLEGAEPRLIDEWQRIPRLWDSVRTAVDRRGGFGHFILTGSATPVRREKDSRRHTGTGRIARLMMRPFSLLESGDSDGSVSLSSLFDGNEEISGTCRGDIDRLAFLCCRGGWPEVCTAGNISDRAALMVSRSYVQAICSNEVEVEGGAVHDRSRMALFLRSYARTAGSQRALSEMAADLSSGTFSFSDKTIYEYHRHLRRIFAIEDMPAWNVNLRSKTAIRTSDTRYFCDPSILTASLGLGPGDLINDLRTFGFVFENLDGEVFHYRDKNNLECDAVIHLASGRYGLVEIKLGGKEAIDHGASTLIKLAERIDTKKMGKPSFMMVLTGIGDYAYRRPDGVFVVPAGLLGI